MTMFQWASWWYTYAVIGHEVKLYVPFDLSLNQMIIIIMMTMILIIIFSVITFITLPPP
jgi:hypothetical protein